MWALLPLKELPKAKQRLSGMLSVSERQLLSKAMAEDVLEVLACHPLLENVLLVSDDPIAKRLAKRYDVEWLSEAALRATGLNAVVQSAMTYLAGQGVDDVMVVHGDLPLINAEELTAAILAYQSAKPLAVTVVPDRWDQGSNCLLCSTTSGMRVRYGKDSLTAHEAQARALRASFASISLPGLACDIDWPQDLAQLLRQATVEDAEHTLRYLSSAGLLKRIHSLVFEFTCYEDQYLQSAGARYG